MITFAAPLILLLMAAAPLAADETGQFSSVVAEIEIKLVEVDINSNQLTITMLAVNNGDSEFPLRLDWAKTRIIDTRGNIFTYEDAGSRSVGNIRSNLDLPVGIPVQLNVVFTRAVTSIEAMRLLEMHFPFTDDIIWWEDVPVPYGVEE